MGKILKESRKNEKGEEDPTPRRLSQREKVYTKGSREIFRQRIKGG